MFTCPLCAKTFSVQHNLQTHIFTHTKEKPHKCLSCPASFSHPSSLKTHIKLVHDRIKVQRLECHVCGHKSTTRGNLKQHMSKHLTDRPISCSVPGCSFKTKQKRFLQRHVRAVHLRETPYECTSVGCNYKTAAAWGSLHQHLKVHSNERPFACEFPGCNGTFKTKSTLTAHTSGVHSDEKPWKCSTCDFQTKRRDTLNNHQATHSSMKRFKCQVPSCHYASKRKKDLKIHFDRKHRKKGVLCTEPRCNYRCGSTALLKTHLKEHKNPILKCTVGSCNFSTRFKKVLRIHTSRHHGNEQRARLLESRKPNSAYAGPTVEVAETRHCPNSGCGYQTDYPHRFDRHMATHDKEKQYVCKFCPSRFTLVGILEGHLRGHLGEKPYSCSHCDFTAIDGGKLRCHAQRVHSIFVLPRYDEHKSERKCRTCDTKFLSYSEFILHSMTHLKPAVVLHRLLVNML